MKKAIAIIVSLIFVLSFAGLSFAVDKAAAPAPGKAEEKKAPAKIKSVTGDVMAVDATSITVKGKKGDVTATTSDKTKVKMDKEKKAIADVKVGDKVTLKYAEAEGMKTAKTISIHAAKPAAADKAAAKKLAAEDKAAAKKLAAEDKAAAKKLAAEDKAAAKKKAAETK